MKNLTKKLFVMLVAVFMMVGSFVSTVHAEPKPNTDEATVTVEKVEPHTNLKLYKIVEASTNAQGKLTGYQFTDHAANDLIDPNQEVTLTVKNGTDTITAKAADLDKDNDGLIDEEVEIEDTTYTVGNYTDKAERNLAAARKVLYDMEEPNQKSINLAVTRGAIPSDATYETTSGNNKYVQQTVTTGQYIGLLTAPSSSDVTYNPVVLSAGYKGLQKYKEASQAELDNTSITKYYKRVDGTFTEDAPDAETKHLYVAAAWDDANNRVANPTWVADGETKDDQLIAGHLYPHISSGDNAFIYGTTGMAKKSTPDFKKEAKTDFPEADKQLAVVATLANGDCKLYDNGKLVYVKAPYDAQTYNDARNGEKFTKNPNTGIWERDNDGTAFVAANLAELETPDAHLAATTPETAYTAALGERIDYTLKPTIPQYPDNAKNKTLVFVDKFEAGLDFVPGSINLSFETNEEVKKVYTPSESGGVSSYVFYVDSGKKYDASVNSDGMYFLDDTTWTKVDSTVTPAVVPDANAKLYNLLAKAQEASANGETKVNGNTFQINFNYDALPGEEGSKQSPTIKYNGVLNEDAIVGIPGNVNVARMYYAKNSGEGSDWNIDKFEEPSADDYKERHDEGRVYTYQFKFRKTNDKEEFIEKTTGTVTDNDYYLLKDLNNDWTNEQKTRYNALLSKAVTYYKANGTADPSGQFTPDGLLIKKSELTEPGDEVFYDNTKYYVDNTGTGAENFKVLEGAVFGVYKTDACKPEDQITTITTDSRGIGYSSELHGNDTYYLKEIKAPLGYSLNNNVYPVKPEWTSATTWTTDTVSSNSYEVITATDTNAVQTGWIVAKEGEKNGVFYDMKGNNPVDGSAGSTVNAGRYFGDGTGDGVTAWKYSEIAHTMTLGDVVVKFVYRAKTTKSTSVTTYDSDTVYNNNGGTLYLARVNNTKTSELPSTGGIGTYLFTIAGVAIIATAAFMLIFRKKEGHTH